VHCIFIGGGTPSLFSPQAIDRLLADIRARLRLTPDCEITLITPAPLKRTVRAFAPQELRGCPSVQSFDDQFLTALGRVHDRAQAIAVEEAASAFETLQPDIMYALPGQTLSSSAGLCAALALQPPHISIYHPTIGPTPTSRSFRR
jgi:oxygen-independent coproporphyrinogen-3 oxidase